MNIKKVLLGFVLAALCTPVFAQTPVTELNFFKKQSQSEDKQLLEAIAGNLTCWIERNPTLPEIDDALYLRADLQSRIGQYPAAYITLLRHKYEVTSSKNAGAVKELTESVIKELRRKDRDAASAAFAAPVKGDGVDGRLASFLAAATQLNLKDTYAPMQEEFTEFFTRFPNFAGKDKLELMLGDLYRQNKNYQAAIMQYNKVYDIYPATGYKAASLRMMGDIYCGELKDYAKADYYYHSVLKNFPDSIELGVTYHHLAMLQEEQGNYKDALDSLDKAIEIYQKANQNEDLYDALRYKAEMQKIRTKDYAASTDTLKKTADIFAKDQTKYVDTMFEAASIYDHKLKDPYGQLNSLESIVIAYPDDPKAPQALFDAGYLAEDLKEMPKAKADYQRLIVTYPANSLAIRAQRRLNAINIQEAKDEAAAADAQVRKAIAAPTAAQAAASTQASATQTVAATAAPVAAAQPAVQTATVQAKADTTAKTAVSTDDGQEADDSFFEVEDDSATVKSVTSRKAHSSKKAK